MKHEDLKKKKKLSADEKSELLVYEQVSEYLDVLTKAEADLVAYRAKVVAVRAEYDLIPRKIVELSEAISEAIGDSQDTKEMVNEKFNLIEGQKMKTTWLLKSDGVIQAKVIEIADLEEDVSIATRNAQSECLAHYRKKMCSGMGQILKAYVDARMLLGRIQENGFPIITDGEINASVNTSDWYRENQEQMFDDSEFIFGSRGATEIWDEVVDLINNDKDRAYAQDYKDFPLQKGRISPHSERKLV